jgi:hypothetical protein
VKITAIILVYSLLLFSCSPSDEGSNTTKNSNTISAPVCPSGFIYVLGNGGLGTNNFCVMKYEARDLAGQTVSVSTGTPLVAIKAVDSQLRCEAITESGYNGTFSMISNSEWMTIARDIESTKENWSGGDIGLGKLLRGHSDNVPSNILNIVDNTNSYDGTGNSSADAVGSGWEQARTHQLSNGSVIWDFAGNVWEWVDWDADTAGYNLGPIDEATGFKNLNTAPTGSLNIDDFQSAGNYPSSAFVGFWAGGAGGAAFRGGQYNNNSVAGIYTIALYLSANISVGEIGIRCVYRP